ICSLGLAARVFPCKARAAAPAPALARNVRRFKADMLISLGSRVRSIETLRFGGWSGRKGARCRPEGERGPQTLQRPNHRVNFRVRRSAGGERPQVSSENGVKSVP